MNRYTIDLTITAESNNEQVIQLKAPHLTGKQVHDLVGISVEGIVIEPEPAVMVVPKKNKKPRLMLRRSRNINLKSDLMVEPPEGFSDKEIENI